MPATELLLQTLNRTARGALACALSVLATTAPALEHPATAAALACERRNPSLVDYTFNMNVALRMRHFPWLRFGIGGNGKYIRGRVHTVTFTKMPSFASGFHQVDLSPLDPCMWPRSYAARIYSRRGGTTTFLLRPKAVDPQDKNPMVDAFVTIGPEDSTVDAVLDYVHGNIQLALRPAAVGEYRLPVSANVAINMPGQDLQARADLTDYVITRRSNEVRKGTP